MKKYTLLFLLVPMFAAAQENGIHFQHNTSWGAVRAKAKAEHKLIFMDCYTTWCGPCRYMSANIFPLEEVGKFMNEKFISVKVQLDTTAADNEEVKSWYKVGHDIASQYHIQAYPTYLFFDADGNAVHRAIGAGPAEDFIAKAKDALNPESQYYTLLNQYNRGQKDSAFLLKAATASMHAYDMETAKKLAEEYLATQNNLYTKTNLDFIINFTERSADKGFAMMLNNAAKVNEVLGKGMAENITMKIIMREEVFSYFSDDPSQPPDWNNISSAIEKKYPAQSPEILAKSKVIWYQYAKDWDNYQRSIIEFMGKYGDNVMP
ncbi:MAG TPA: thioredoxin fold domain-containing protein, partial [Chitinophagaceae bacterium]|nr:thioredoxin fold domain-containing protein [Chitinophagaceae bacterium]